MPTYEFLHDIEGCKHEWEEFRSITASDPTHCPVCGAEGNIVHLISGGSGKGIVELTGHELTSKVKEDVRKLKSDAAQNESTYANLLGEGRYQQLQTQMDRNKRNR
jgi:hypothetical protein